MSAGKRSCPDIICYPRCYPLSVIPSDSYATPAPRRRAALYTRHPPDPRQTERIDQCSARNAAHNARLAKSKTAHDHDTARALEARTTRAPPLVSQRFVQNSTRSRRPTPQRPRCLPPTPDIHSTLTYNDSTACPLGAAHASYGRAPRPPHATHGL